MKRARLEKILSAYGADAARWPEAEREAAQRLIAGDAGLMAQAGAERALDRLLARVPAGEVSEALLTRILETASAHISAPARARSRSPWLGRAFGGIALPSFGAIALRPAAILMLAVCLGFGAGVVAPALQANTPSEVTMLATMWGSPSFNQDGSNL